MSFVSGFIHNIDSQFVGQFQVFFHRRIMTGPNAVNIELFHQIKIFPDSFHIHGVPQIGVLHVAVHAVKFHRNAIHVISLMFDFYFFETNPVGQGFGGFS